jgi:hypothetical protein
MQGGMNHGMIIGLAVGIPLVVFGAFVAFIIWTMRRRKYNRSQPTMTPTDSYTDYNQSTEESKASSLHEAHAEASGIPVIELDVPISQPEVKGNPRYELDSASIPSPIVQSISPASPALGSAYIPYQRPNDDQVLSTSSADTPILAANSVAEPDAGGGKPEVQIEITVAK